MKRPILDYYQSFTIEIVLPFLDYSNTINGHRNKNAHTKQLKNKQPQRKPEAIARIKSSEVAVPLYFLNKDLL